MTRRRRVASAALCAALTSPVAQPPAPDPRGYVCYRADAPIQVDGRLDEAEWRNAPWTEDFLDIEGETKPKPAMRTRVRMLWDDEYFYVGAELVEPHLWATLTRHDAVIFQDDDFEVFIDPNGDSHEYYEFEINALGTTWDLLLPRPYKDGGEAVDNWEVAGLKSAVHLGGTLNDATDADQGWSVEIAFPWSALGEVARRPSPPRDGDQWRVNFSRVDWPLEISAGRYRKTANGKESNWVWSPQHVVDMHRPESWGYVQFASGRAGPLGALGHVRFEPDPSLPARRWLHQVYYAQREYRRAHRRWARTLEELGIPVPSDASLGRITLQVTDHLFEASVDLRLPGRTPQRWHIRQDALVWAE